MSQLVSQFLAVEKELNGLFQERTQAIRGIILATLSQTNILFLGPAGIAKSALINQWNKRITGGKYFSWLLTKFSAPEEIFGPPSLKGLEEERYYRVVKNKLPEATTAFLDEIFKANSSILNSLLTVLNERVFYNDGIPVPIDVVTIAGASNEIPEAEDNLAAFFDRFLLKYQLKPIQESSSFRKMLLSNAFDNTPSATVTLQDIREAQAETALVKVPDIALGYIVKLRDELRKEGISVTDRTFKTSIRILQAQAWLHSREEITTDDLEIYKNICWSKPEDEKKVHTSILQLISPEKNKVQGYYEDCLEISKAVYKQRDAVKKQGALVEANKKIKEAQVEIMRLKKEMIAKKQDITDITNKENELAKLMISMANDVLGVNIASFVKEPEEGTKE